MTGPLPGPAPFGEPVTVRYSEAMLRRAVRLFMVRRVFRQRQWYAAAALLAVAAGLCGWTGSPFLAGLFGGVLCLLPVFVAAVWLAHLRNTVGRFRTLRPPEAEFRFGPAGFAVASSAGNATVPWSSITACWQQPEFCMLFTAPSQFITLPTGDLPPGLLPVILACVARRA